MAHQLRDHMTCAYSTPWALPVIPKGHLSDGKMKQFQMHKPRARSEDLWTMIQNHFDNFEVIQFDGDTDC